jgi:hypothetical protein
MGDWRRWRDTVAEQAQLREWRRDGALDAAADAEPDLGLHDCGRGFVLETMTQDGRLYPTALRSA